MRASAVCCVFLLALAAGNVPVRASGTNRGLSTDDKVAIVLKPSALFFSSCPILPSPTMNVRLQTLKTKSGAIFHRKAVTDDVFACLTALGSQPLAASSIQECSEHTMAAGLEMFRWDGGQCTGYTNGIPRDKARCAGAGSLVLYSVDKEAIGPLLVVGNIKLAFSGNILIHATWDVTPNLCFGSYRVSFNNQDTFVSEELATVGLETALPCAEYNLTVTPVDTNHAAMGPAVTAQVVIPGAIELSLNVMHGVTAVKATWGVVYTCNPNKPPTTVRPPKSYSVKIGNQARTTDKSTFEFTFNKRSGRCSDTASSLTADLNEVTVAALDGNGTQLGNVSATLTDTNMPGHRYSPVAPNCIYYQNLNETPGGVGVTFDQLKDFCQKTMLSGPFNNQQKDDYMSEISKMRNFTPSVIVAPHFVDLKRVWVWVDGNRTSTNKFVWLDTTEEPSRIETRGLGVINPPVPWWDSGEPSSVGDCAELKSNFKLAAVSCDAKRAIVCYDYLT